ncbi:MAG: hypothetical protein KDI07_15845 [Anaerolineae bacterium]|nr:hypothetical protein [Anaerolineae bacterium]
MHARRTIREAVTAVLKAAAITGIRVYENRLYPVAESDLPCLLVISGGDRSDNLDMSNDPLQQRAVRVEIRAIVKTSKDLDDALEAICSKVEQAMASAVFGFKAGRRYVGTEHRENALGNQPVGESRIFYEFEIMTRQSDPETMK